MARLHRSRALAAYVALLLMVEAGWLVNSHRVPEGAVLVRLTPDHGITAVDVAGVALVALALAVFVQALLLRRRTA